MPQPRIAEHGDFDRLKPWLFRSNAKVVFYRERMKRYGVQVCGGERFGQTRKILGCLCAKRPNGKFVACSSTEWIVGTIRDFRRHVSEALATELGIACGLQDVILSSGAGYRPNEDYCGW